MRTIPPVTSRAARRAAAREEPATNDGARARDDVASVRLLAPGEHEVRCGCGSLLARVVRGALELKCRRCKRTWRIPLDPA